MIKYAVIVDYEEVLKNLETEKAKMLKLYSLGNNIGHAFINRFLERVRPHSKSLELGKSFLGNFKVNYSLQLGILQVDILKVSELPIYWNVLDKGSAGVTTIHGKWLWQKHPVTGEDARFVPGEWNGSVFEYDPESKTGMWVTKQIKGINWIKYGGDKGYDDSLKLIGTILGV